MGALNSNIFVTGRMTVAAANKKYIPNVFGYVGNVLPRSSTTGDEAEAKYNAPL